MATKTRAPMPLPPMPGEARGDVPPPLPPSRRAVPPPPTVETSRPPQPKGRQQQPVTEPEPEYDEDADNTEMYDEFEIATDDVSDLPPPDENYDEWEAADTPSLEYEVPDEIPNKKNVSIPSLPSRNAPLAVESQESEAVYEVTDEQQIPEEIPSKKAVSKPSLPSRNPPPTPVAPAEDFYEEAPDQIDQEQLYEVPDDTSSAPPPPSLPSRTAAERPPLAVPSGKREKEKKQKKSVSSAPGISIAAEALGSVLKGLKRVPNSSPKPEEPTKAEEKSSVSTKNINMKDAINKFNQPNDKPAMLPKPNTFSKSSSPSPKSSAGSVSSPTDSRPALPGRSGPSKSESVTSAKDLPLPQIPTEESSDVFDEIYDDVASNNMLHAYSWYHGDISRDEAEQRLKKLGENGTFLLRDSKKSADQPYTLVLLYNNAVKNLKVRLRHDKQYALGEEKKDELTFNEVTEMVEHHKMNEVILIKEQAKVKLQRTPPIP